MNNCQPSISKLILQSFCCQASIAKLLLPAFYCQASNAKLLLQSFYKPSFYCQASIAKLLLPAFYIANIPMPHFKTHPPPFALKISICSIQVARNPEMEPTTPLQQDTPHGDPLETPHQEIQKTCSGNSPCHLQGCSICCTPTNHVCNLDEALSKDNAIPDPRNTDDPPPAPHHPDPHQCIQKCN